MDSANPLARGSIIFGLEMTRTASSGGGGSRRESSAAVRPPGGGSIWEEDHDASVLGKASFATNRATGEFIKLVDVADEEENKQQPLSPSSPSKASSGLYSKLRNTIIRSSDPGAAVPPAPLISSVDVPSPASPPSTTAALLKPAASWRVALRAGRPLHSWTELQPFCRHLRNVREAKLAPLFTADSSLSQIEFGNNTFTLDELEACAVLMLERVAPRGCLSSMQGVQCAVDLVVKIRHEFKPPFNAYHDFRHAVDGMQFMYFLVQQCDDVQDQFVGEPEWMRLLLVVAALVQDVAHDGKSSQYHKDTSGSSALHAQYGPDSALEKMHYATAERVLKESKLLELVFTGEGDTGKFLTKLRALILCTDMSRHSELVQQFSLKPTASSVFLLLIKLSDVSNVAREFDEARVWARRLDAERKLQAGASAVPLARTVADFSQKQVLPLTQAMETVLGMPHTGKLLGWRIESNIYRWRRMDEAGEPTAAAEEDEEDSDNGGGVNPGL